MFKNEKLTKAFVSKISKAEKLTLDAYQTKRVEHEPSITDRLLANIEYGINETEISGVKWTAKTLTSIGKNAQEVKYGADFLSVLDLNLPGYKIKKGFLVQSKRLEPGQRISKNEFDNLQAQCDLMLSVSPVSYIFIYSLQSGIRVVSANDVISADICNVLELETWSLNKFFQSHIECFIGDKRLHNANPDSLIDLSSDLRVRKGLLISGSSFYDKVHKNIIG